MQQAESDERAIRAWLDAIGEMDAETIADVLTQCRLDPQARRYYLQRTKELHHD